MGEVGRAFSILWGLIDDFARSPHEKDALYLDKLKQWKSISNVSSFYSWKMQRINSFTQERICQNPW